MREFPAGVSPPEGSRSPAVLTGIDMTRGPILANLFRLGAPVFIANLFEGLHSVVNMFWLGRLPDSAQAMNAPVISFQLLFLATSVGVGISQAGAALVGQARGAGRLELVRGLAGQIVLFMGLYFGCVTMLGLGFTDDLLRLIRVPAESYGMVRPYFRIVAAGMMPISLVFAYRALGQGVGDTRTPMLVDTMAVMLNMAFDPILIFGAHLGVRGAAWATVGARGAASIVALWLLARPSGPFRVNVASLRPVPALLGKVGRIGLPAGLGMAGSSLGFAVITRLVASHGAVAVAAFGLASRLFQLFMLPSMAATSAVTTAVAQCLGAGLRARAATAVRLTILALPGSLLIPMLLLATVGDHLALVFTRDPAVAHLAHRIFIIAGAAPLLFGVQSVLHGAFVGGGVTVFTMVAAILRLWGLRVPFAYLLASRIGLDAVWASMVVSNLGAVLFLWFGYSRGLWDRRQL